MTSKLIAAAVATLAIVSAPAAHAQSFINVLTGGTSGVYYPMGVAIWQNLTATRSGSPRPGAGDQGVGRESGLAAARKGPRSRSRWAIR